MLHINKFPRETSLLRFMGAETPHKKVKLPSTYVYELDPKGYFGEEDFSNYKNDNKIKNKENKKTK